jgi:membrane associated rhomboid family serine protease/DNA-directed RNA polymerase subunit RPC12/RpoP
MESSSPELSVVCKNCGAEVSPYVTECPYCGTRLRKRAPKLERVGDEVRVREGRREKRRRRAAARRERRSERMAVLADRPVATIAAILAPALLLVIERATNLTVFDLGAIVGPVDAEWWRYFAAPFVYDDIGYLFACGLAVAIFVPGIEARIGAISAALLVIACGALGMLAADGLETAFGDGVLVAAGGNGIALGLLCAWLVMRRAEVRHEEYGDGIDVIGVAVAAAVLVLLPAFVDWASVFAGLGGAAVGAACGFVATLARRPRSPAG